MARTNAKEPELLHDLYKWRKIEVPKMWSPNSVGDELRGFFIGRSVRVGQHGEYTVILVAVPNVGAYCVTGVRIVQLVDASMVQPGQPVRVVWQGLLPLASGHSMKQFDFYIAEGSAVEVDDLPAVAR